MPNDTFNIDMGDTPEIGGTEPLMIEVKEGKTYWWCACGKSKNQPFCDGSHQGSSFEPQAFEAKRDGKIFFCTCKRTQKSPLCDGSHNGL